MICRACRSDRLDPVFEMDPMPLAGAFAPTAAAARAMPRYPLTWLLCHDCGLVNVAPDIPDEVIYRTYSYAASTVPALVRHHRELASILAGHYPKGTRLLEIGGNDGVLLRQLPKDWYRLNVDPSDIAVYGNAHGDWDVIREPFSLSLAERLEPFDVVTSSNAFAHFTDIAGALEGVARALTPGGEFWLEVHDLAATLWHGQWDTIYHEHKVEWSWHSIAANLARVGLHIAEAWKLPLHGGLLRARCVKGEVARHPGILNELDEDFALLQQTYTERRFPPPPLIAHSAAYGAAGRATVYLNQMWPLPIDYVVDASPVRAGKFVPGIGIPVLSPEVFEQDRPETTLITAWNHAADIRARHPDYEGWVSTW